MPQGDEQRIGRAGLQGAVDRLRTAVPSADAINGPLVPLSEALHWMYACDQWLRDVAGDTAYRSMMDNPRQADQETLDALLLARGRLTHQLAIGGEVVGLRWGDAPWGSTPWGRPGWIWSSQLPPDTRPRMRTKPTTLAREARYNCQVADQPLMRPIDRAVPILLQHLPR